MRHGPCIRILTLFIFSITRVSSSTACIDVTISDLMGDGWGNAFLKVSTITNNIIVSEQSYTPTEGENPKTLDVCVSASDPSIITLSMQESKGYILEAPWEIMWSANVNYGAFSFAGLFNTTMQLSYSPMNSRWTLLSASNLAHKNYQCAAQIGSLDEVCGNSDVVLLDPTLLYVQNLVNERNDKKFSTFEIDLYDTQSKGWFSSDGQGSTWYITDDSRSSALALGTMTEAVTMERQSISLCDGSYYFRVTGALDTYAKDHYWYFCGVYGAAGDELSFFVENGECISSQHFSASLLVSGNLRTTLTLHGTLSLAGLPDYFSLGASELSTMKTVLMNSASTFLVASNCELTASDAKVLSSQPNLGGNLNVGFSASLVLEDFGYDGTNKFRLSSFSDMLLTDIGYYVSTGSYLLALQARASRENDDNLAAVQAVTMSDLKVSAVSYAVLQSAAKLTNSELLDLTQSPSDSRGDEATITTYMTSLFDYGATLGFLLACGCSMVVLVSCISASFTNRQLDDSDHSYASSDEGAPGAGPLHYDDTEHSSVSGIDPHLDLSAMRWDTENQLKELSRDQARHALASSS